MAAAIAGAVILLITMGPRVFVVLALRRRGRPIPVLRLLLFNPMAWIGLAMVIGSVSPIAGGFVFVVGGAITIGVLVIGLIRGAWRFPTAVRLIGDPEAWRGERRPYWEKAPRTSA